MSIDDLYSGRHVTELSIAVFWRWISFAVKVLIHWWLWNDAQSLKWHGRGALLFFRPPPLGPGGIMFSGCPSIRPRSEIPYFYLYIGPLVHPTIRDRFAACPSVRRDFRAFAGECMEGINGLKFGMLMYLGHLQNWLVYGHSLLIFLILVLFWLMKRVKFGVSRHFLDNPLQKCPEILHADVSWPPWELINLWSR